MRQLLGIVTCSLCLLLSADVQGTESQPDREPNFCDLPAPDQSFGAHPGLLAEDVHLLVTFTVGNGWLFGEMKEVFSGIRFDTFIQLGVEWKGWRADVYLTATDLSSTMLADPRSYSVGAKFFRQLDLWADDGMRIGLAPHVGGGYVHLTDDHAPHQGWAVGVGGEIYFSHQVADYMEYRVVTDLTQQWVRVESAELNRHIHGEILHWTLGGGLSF